MSRDYVKELEQLFQQLGLTKVVYAENQVLAHFAGSSYPRPDDGEIYFGTEQTKLVGIITHASTGLPTFSLNVPEKGAFCYCNMAKNVYWYEHIENTLGFTTHLKNPDKALPRLRRLLGWSSSKGIR
jgi:hypothetical protein